ncbi:uncharacterized protein N7483_002814 [Penicillium malachiteum]|uniref:uncharacterized protein n=1 Tax=Penicillium malachiteum TaxID=1324776 RepID=UPI0025472AFD|nr:uncharacterized protein N7483_002814 [Penicillium malachiteum]KAJ5737689.1 hypothetical protein N7483_002814 [Penicillium malachiteum]
MDIELTELPKTEPEVEATTVAIPEDVDFVEDNVHTYCAPFQWLLIVLTILSSTFLFSLDNTIVADVQSPVVEAFGDVNKLSWLGVAFALSSSATIITWGKLYAIFSARTIYLGSIVLFEIGSTICGAARNMNVFIAGRAIAGLGGAGMYLGCLTLLSVTTSVRQRPAYMALTGITWGSGTVLGPIVGGAFSQNVNMTWRWAFYINLCIGGILSPVFVFYLPKGDPQPEVRLKRKLLQIDYLGILLNTGTFSALIMAINFGGTLFAWGAGQEIALWVVGGVLLIMFALQQRFTLGTTEGERIFPADFLSRPLMWLLFAEMSAAGTCVFIPTYYIPLYCQFVIGDSPLTAAVRLLPFILLMVFFGLLNGAMMMRFGLYMPWYLVGGILTSVGGGLMSTVDELTPIARIYGYCALIGIGSGLFIQTSFSVAQAKNFRSRGSDATSFIALAQNLGIVLALAISGAIFQNQALGKLEKLLPDYPREVLQGALMGTNSDLLKHIPKEVQREALHAIVNAMSHTYYLVIAAGVMAAVGSLVMKRERIFIQAATIA